MLNFDCDVLVVGAGISGATLAERYGNLGKKVLVVEKRNHIAGNCYDYKDDAGILVPKYGPHFFHTNNKDVWDYVSQFTSWHAYEHRVLAQVSGKLVPVPVNITTINKIFNLEIKTQDQAQKWLSENREKILNPKNSEEMALSRVGRVLYDKIFKNYTFKQWAIWPKDLDPSVTARIPVRDNFDDRYFTDVYQAMPKEGYTKLFEQMLKSPNIKVFLNTDYFQIQKEMPKYKKLFFTGPIDRFFENKGIKKLAYRSLRFEHLTVDKEFFQQCAQVNFPNDFEYTRISEPKHATGQVSKKTTIIKEYPQSYGEPYYPIPNAENHAIYAEYQKEAKKLEKNGVYFVGRLANYKYFNMDQAFKASLDLFSKLEKKTLS